MLARKSWSVGRHEVGAVKLEILLLPVLNLKKKLTHTCLHTKLAALDVCLFTADTNSGFIGGIIGGSIGGAFIVGIIVGVCLFILWKRDKVCFLNTPTVYVYIILFVFICD